MAEEKKSNSSYGKISLAGDVGSGKSTVSKILIERLGAIYHSTGAICRDLAMKYGIDITSMNQYMETHPEIDKEIDDTIKALSDKDECMIIDSRMAWHFVRDTFRVYMTTEPLESAKRILRAKRAEERATTVEEMAERNRARKASENKRYAELYGVDCGNLSNYSLIVDSTYASPEEVAECILSCFADWQEDHTRRYAYICHRRFLYPDEGTDEGRAAKISELLDRDGDGGDAYATECDGEFYLTDNAEVALAYAMSDIALVPTKLTVGKKPSGQFVKMTDTF